MFDFHTFLASFFNYCIERFWLALDHITLRPGGEGLHSTGPHLALFQLCPSSPTSYVVSTHGSTVLCLYGSSLIPGSALASSLSLSSRGQTLILLCTSLGLMGGQETTVHKEYGQSFCRRIGMAMQVPVRPLRPTKGPRGGKNALALSMMPLDLPWNSEHLKNHNLELSHIINPWEIYFSRSDLNKCLV